jgi:putative ABC transport system permease protein
VDRGRFLTQTDTENEANHCVLASGTAAKLFPFEDPIGQAILVEEDYYVVVGVMKPRMPTSGIGGSFSGQDFDRDVYIPIRTLWNRIGDFIVTRRSGSFSGEIVELNQITLQMDDVKDVMEASDLIREMIQRHHELKDFGITIPLELLEQAKTTRMMFILFMGLIAAISLLVGGIGIMNIMLATVTERTREIGIRRALGAKRRDIIRQFLVETISLSIVGGITGVLAGLTCGPLTSLLRNILQKAIPDVMEQLPAVIQNVQPEIVPMSIPLAFGISVTIGVLFGIYPAMRAAAMDPIEALRHE